MKELKVDFSKFYPNLIVFITDVYQDDYIFLETRNFKTEPIKTAFKQLYVSLESNLDLKYFKMEIL